MAQFESRKLDIEAAKAQVVFIAAEKRKGVWRPEKYLEKHPISFPFLLDEDRTVTKAYGLHNALAADALNIAHPATLVVDSSGIVRYLGRGKNQQERAPLEEVLKAVTEIGKS
jgi:peroxiredoxin